MEDRAHPGNPRGLAVGDAVQFRFEPGTGGVIQRFERNVYGEAQGYAWVATARGERRIETHALRLRRSASRLRDRAPSRDLSSQPDAHAFVAALRSHLSVGDRQVRIKVYDASDIGGAGAVSVSYVNLPEGVGGAGGGAEAMNNRAIYWIKGFAGYRRGHYDKPIGAGSVRLEEGVTSFTLGYRLRGKTGKPDAVARYLGAHLNRVAREVPPRFTHTEGMRDRARRR
jgi:hypothetical protein